MEVTLTASPRPGSGKGVARKLRADGMVPGTLYGSGSEATNVAVDLRALTSALHTEAGRNVLIDLQVDGQAHLTLARELQRDPVRGTILHVDFLKIARDQAIVVDVPIHIEGESPGVREGGVVEHHLWNMSVECLPTNVPDRIVADISNVALGASLHVRDIAPPDGVQILTDPDEVVLSVVVPQVLKVEEEVPAAAAGEEPVAEEAAATPEAPAPPEE